MNIVLVILDTLRADYLGCYGNVWIRTPHMDRLASESVVFDEAYAEGCPTLQARRALWTGRRTFPFADHKVVPGDALNLQPGWMPLHNEDVCLSEMLRDDGYLTTYITDTPHIFKPGMNYHRGFMTYEFIRGQSGDPVQTGYRLPGDRAACAGRPVSRSSTGKTWPLASPCTSASAMRAHWTTFARCRTRCGTASAR